jgi:putative membrane protein
MVPDWLAGAAGSVLILFGCFCFVAGVWRDLYSGAPPPAPDVRKLPPWLLVAVNLFLILVALTALAGMWVG